MSYGRRATRRRVRTWEKSYAVAGATFELHRIGYRRFRLLDAWGLAICDLSRIPDDSELADLVSRVSDS